MPRQLHSFQNCDCQSIPCNAFLAPYRSIPLIISPIPSVCKRSWAFVCFTRTSCQFVAQPTDYMNWIWLTHLWSTNQVLPTYTLDTSRTPAICKIRKWKIQSVDSRHHTPNLSAPHSILTVALTTIIDWLSLLLRFPVDCQFSWRKRRKTWHFYWLR